MHSRIELSDVRLTSATDRDAERGLLGYLSFVLNGALQLDGLTLRRRQDGSRYVAFPARRDGAGRDHPYVRPLGEPVRLAIEREILRQLGLAGVAL